MIRLESLELVSVDGILSWASHSMHVGLWLRDTGAKMFNISRIPRLGCDILTTKPPPTDHDARKVLVMLHDWFYAVEVFDKDMRMLEPAEIERRLLSVVADADHRLAQGEVATAVSVLTTDGRDRWAEVGRQLLLRLSGELTSFSEPPPSSLFITPKPRYPPNDQPLPLRTQPRAPHLHPPLLLPLHTSPRTEHRRRAHRAPAQHPLRADTAPGAQPLVRQGIHAARRVEHARGRERRALALRRARPEHLRGVRRRGERRRGRVPAPCGRRAHVGGWAG